MKCLLVLIISAWCVISQPLSIYNNDTTHYHSFNADSFAFGNITYLTSSSANMFVVLADDTSSSGYSGDSIKLDFGIRYGTVTVKSNNRKDTTFGPLIRVGTMSTLAADTAGKWTDVSLMFSTDSTTGEPPLIQGVMDSVNVTGYACLKQRFVTIKPDHLVQPWVKGLTGNITGSYLRLLTQITQLEWLPVKR